MKSVISHILYNLLGMGTIIFNWKKKNRHFLPEHAGKQSPPSPQNNNNNNNNNKQTSKKQNKIKQNTKQNKETEKKKGSLLFGGGGGTTIYKCINIYNQYNNKYDKVNRYNKVLVFFF